VRSVVQIYLGPPPSGALGGRRQAIGAVAQLGERRPCKAEVVGSIPISSTIPPAAEEWVAPGLEVGCAVARVLGNQVASADPSYSGNDRMDPGSLTTESRK
jgi:hypothetical protein